MKNKSLDNDVERFVLENMSIESPENFLPMIGKRVEDYTPVHLSVSCIGETDDAVDIVHKAELKLAEEAINVGCEYVTNMDYVKIDYRTRSSTIAARGLRLKKK